MLDLLYTWLYVFYFFRLICIFVNPLFVFVEFTFCICFNEWQSGVEEIKGHLPCLRSTEQVMSQWMTLSSTLRVSFTRKLCKSSKWSKINVGCILNLVKLFPVKSGQNLYVYVFRYTSLKTKIRFLQNSTTALFGSGVKLKVINK